MVGHGHPLDPNVELGRVDNYNLMHFTHRQDCPAAIYTEIVRRLRENPLSSTSGLVLGDLFESLVFAPVERLPEELRAKIVELFYDVEYVANDVLLWKNQNPWLPYVEG